MGPNEVVAALTAKIDHAADDVRVAEQELETALGQLSPLSVGDKQLITPRLEGCLEKLRTAKRQVSDLRQLLGRA